MQKNIVFFVGFSSAITALLCGLAKNLVASGLFVIASALWYIISILLDRGE